MTNQEILEKAIQKAIDGGWDGFDLNGLNVQSDFDDFASDRVSWPTIIFNHDFAKALWGEKLQPWFVVGADTKEAYINVASWEAHLQQMVIADDPIKYLGDHVL